MKKNVNIRQRLFSFLIVSWLKKMWRYICELQRITFRILRFRSYSRNLSASFLQSGYSVCKVKGEYAFL